MLKLRKNVLKQRQELSSELHQNYSELIRTQFLCNFLDRTAFFIYLNYNGEVNTLELIKILLNSGKRVFIPKTYSKNKVIRPVEIRGIDFEKYLIQGFCSIYEPSDDYSINNFANIEDIDVIVCPGSVFDKSGGRMGYGGGYYDRFLSRPDASDIVKIGFAFDFQVFDEIILQKHDVKMDFVITNTLFCNC